MKHKDKIGFLLVALLFIVSLCWPVCKSDFDDFGKFQYVSHFSDSIDMNLIRQSIGDNKIVMLGELTDNDGTVLEVKSDLVKMLHKKPGFDAIIFKSGNYDVWLMNYLSKIADTCINPKIGIEGKWSNPEEMSDFWKYISNNEISVSGYGFNPCSGNLSDEQRFSFLEQYLSTKEINLNDYHDFMSMKGRLLWSFFDKMYSDSVKMLILGDIEDIVKLCGEPVDDIDRAYINYLTGLGQWLNMSWFKNGSEYENDRDSILVQNISRIIGESDERKVIVWTDNLDCINLRQRLDSLYHNNCYTICFTSYCRMNSDRTFSYGVGSNSSLENHLHKLSKSSVFIDFTDSIIANSFDGKFKLKIEGGYDIKNNWHERIDGLIFLDTIYDVVEK